MKKYSRIFLLCLLIFIGAVEGHAQLARQQLRMSPSQLEQYASVMRGLKSNNLLPKEMPPFKTSIAGKQTKKIPLKARIASNATTLCGSVIASDNTDAALGFYSFTATESTTFTELYTGDGWSSIAATGGGVVKENIYYIFQNGGGWSNQYYAFSLEDWKTLKNSYIMNSALLPTDLTYDATTDQVYGAYVDETTATLKIFDPEAVSVTEIGTLSTALCAIAADKAGQLWGIGTDGVLYKIDKTTAALTSVGSTGLTPANMQSATFDIKNGILYWAAYLEDNTSGLYSVDTTTGAATKITAFPNNEEVTALYIAAPEAEDGAPAVATDLTANFSQGATTGTLTFTLPTTTYAGATLSGELDYVVLLDGEEYATGKGEAGTTITVNVETTSGDHTFVVTTTNSAGKSPKAKLSLYVGKAVPGYIYKVTATEPKEDGEVTISWTAPTQGQGEGYFDPSEVTYTVERISGSTRVTIAENIKDTFCIDHLDMATDLTTYYYSVTPYVDELKGGNSFSNNVKAGAPLEIPFGTSFSSYNDVNLFTIIDANNDGVKWGKGLWSNYVQCGDRWASQTNDDWLITPPLHLEKGKAYHLYVHFAGLMEVKMGRAATVEGMTTEIMAETDAVSEINEDIMISEEGTYYFGFHATGAAGSTTTIDTLEVSLAGDANAPAAPMDVKAVAAAKGALQATITCVAPEMTISGDRLDALTAIRCYRGDELIGEVANPEVGATVSFTDANAVQGMNTYYVRGVNEAGEGLKGKAEVFVGVDVPGVVAWATLEIVDGMPKITWTKLDTIGANGYYVNPDEVTYTIVRSDNAYVATDLTDTTFVDSTANADEPQRIICYYVCAVNASGQGGWCQTNSVNYGAPASLPFVETFPNGSNDNTPWVIYTNSQRAGWAGGTLDNMGIEDYDGNGGFTTFVAYNEGEAATLVSPMISLEGAEKPVLEYFYYNTANAGDFSLYIAKEDGEFQLAQTVDEAARQGKEEGWTRQTLDLSSYKDAKYISLGFNAIRGSEAKQVLIDYIRIRQEVNRDMQVTAFSVPEKMTLGEETTLTATVKNDGEETAENVAIELYRNKQLVATETGSFSYGETKTYNFAQTPDVAFTDAPEFYVKVVYSGDEIEENNTSETLSASIKQPRYPAVTDLSGTSDKGTVTLSWTPLTDTSISAEPTTDGFETYDAFIIDNIGDWTTIDVDGGTATWEMSNPASFWESLEYEHKGEPMAWMVFNPEKAGIDITAYPNYAAYEGSQMLMTPGDTDWSNDDWLISPELDGNAQTISFYVYSRTGYYQSEKYEVLYSTTDKETESFTKLIDGVCPDSWQKIEVELPEGAKYFAIRNVSQWSNSQFFVDNVNFVAAGAEPIQLKLKGYNIYRNGVKINDELVTEAGFTDLNPGEGDVSYYVSAVYDAGESSVSNEAVITVVTNVRGVVMLSTVKTLPHAISISHAEGLPVAIYAASGATVFQGRGTADNLKVSVASGVYVVKVGDKSVKVLVK